MANITINSVSTRRQYTASAGQTVYTYNFPIKAQTDLKVYSRAAAAPPDDEADLLTLTTDYTVTGANTADGGAVTLVVASTAGDIVTIVGDKTVDRTAIYNQSSTLKKADLNNDFNDNVMYDKQLHTEVYELTPRYNRSELIGPEVRQDNTELPILNDGYVWYGRGNFGDDPDDIIAFDLDAALNGGGGTISDAVNQVAHGFVIGEWIRYNGAAYVSALANTSANAEVVGVVVSVVDADNFVVQQSGKTDALVGTAYGALNPGSVYFLSNTNTGQITTVEPTAINHVSKPALIAITATSGWILPYRGQLNGSGPAVTGTGPGINVIDVNQVAHGFVVEDVLRVSAANTYAKAQADTRANAQAVGIVIEVVDVDNFKIQTEGFTDTFAGKVGASVYYLSAATAGLLTTVEPTGLTEYSKPMFVALNAGAGYIVEQLPTLVGTATGDNNNQVTVTQVAHGFVVGKWLRTTAVNDVYAAAQADTKANSHASGVVVEVPDANTFVLQTAGITDIFAGLTAGDIHYLSAASAGDDTNVEPAGAGNISKPLLSVVNATTAYILEQRPLVQPYAGGGGGGFVELASATAAASATIDFDAVFSATYDNYMIVFENLRFSTTTYLKCRFGTGAGPTYASANYQSSNLVNNRTSGPIDITASGTLDTSALTVCASFIVGTLCGDMKVFGVNDVAAADYKRAVWNLCNGGTSYSYMSASGGVWSVVTALTSIQFYPAAGTFTSGKITVYGLTT